MEYKYLDTEKNETMTVPLERWIWGVVCKPTDEQVAVAEAATRERNIKLKAELEQKEIELRRGGADKQQILEIRDEYAILMGTPVAPETDELKQFGDDGIFHRVGEIQQERVHMFTMYKPDFSGRIDIVLPEGGRIIHKYVNVVLNARTAYEQKIRVYCFGYKAGQHHHHNYIMPDDTVVQADTPDLILTNYGLVK